MALHELSVGKSDEWYTPEIIFEAMALRFDYDPCPALEAAPADAWCADRAGRNGLREEWRGGVWLNPPFGGRNGIKVWLDKFFAHGSGIALTPDRTSAPWWQEAARKADAILFVSPKIRFIPGPGAKASAPAQGTTLLAAGEVAVDGLHRAARNGLGLILGPQVDGAWSREAIKPSTSIAYPQSPHARGAA